MEDTSGRAKKVRREPLQIKTALWGWIRQNLLIVNRFDSEGEDTKSALNVVDFVPAIRKRVKEAES